VRHRSKILNGTRGQVARLKDLEKTFPIRTFATLLPQGCGCGIQKSCIRGQVIAHFKSLGKVFPMIAYATQ